MNYDVGACKNCRKIAGVTKDHKCQNCGADRETVPLYTWFHQDCRLVEKQETIDRMDELDNVQVKASHISGAELKAGLRDLFICLGIAVALLLFGLLCVKGAGGNVKGRMTFMGLLFLIASPVSVSLSSVSFPVPVRRPRTRRLRCFGMLYLRTRHSLRSTKLPKSRYRKSHVLCLRQSGRLWIRYGCNPG